MSRPARASLAKREPPGALAMMIATVQRVHTSPPVSGTARSRADRALLAAALLLASAPALAAPPAASAPAQPEPTESANFTVTHSRPLDALVAAYLVDALESERDRLAGEGVALPEQKLAVEIVPEPRDLDRLTSLDAKAIAAGVPAACEAWKLVLVSPRAAIGGYPWLDAAAKEYRRCALGTAGEGSPAKYPLRWRGAGAPAKASGGGTKAELARDYARLGDILLARGRSGPAWIEYEKAVRRGGLRDPDVVARYAKAASASGEAERAEDALREAAREHPHHAGLQAALGQLAAERGEWAAAREALAASIRVDPFDAEVHEGLAASLEKLGDATGASRERRIAGMLRR